MRHRNLLAVLVVPFVLAARGASAGDANLDPTFGTAGVARPSSPDGAIVAALAQQADEKLVIAGTWRGHALAARFEPGGALDTGYASGGSVSIDFGGVPDQAFAATAQSDGAVVVAGYSVTGANAAWAIARLDATGALDAGFGTGGKVTLFPTGGLNGAGAVVQQSDGKLLVAGRDAGAFVVVRLATDGTLDAGFGVAGVATTSLDAGGYDGALALQTDGKILAGNPTSQGIARLNSDGTPDASFGTGGVAALEWGPSAILPQAGGTIVLLSGPELTVSRRLADGSLDTGFGTGGSTTVPILGTTANVVQLADGRFVTAGASQSEPRAVALARFAANGALDTTFGDGGHVSLLFLDDETAGTRGLGLRTDQKPVVGGFTMSSPHVGPSRVFLARFGSADCGNGVVDAGETCDDGNFDDGDCCTLGCGIGSCGPCGTCNLAGQCVAAPASCDAPTPNVRLSIRDRADDARDQLKWAIGHGPATTLGDLGDPLYRDHYDLCIYDESGAPALTLYSLHMPGGLDNWQRRGAGWRFSRRLNAPYPDGTAELTLIPGARTRVKLKAKGVGLAPPTAPLALPLRVQLRATNGTCFQATYSVAPRNTGGLFGAKSD